MRVSDAELEILQLLWKESPLEATELARRAPPERGWSLTTVKTLLARLVAKEAVNAVAQGRRYQYRPTVTRAEVAAEQTQGLVQRLFGGRVSPLVAQLAEQRLLSDDDLAELEALIRSLKS